MFYRILKSPPGNPLEDSFIVAKYRNKELKSYDGMLCNPCTGRNFFSTIDEARRIIPEGCNRIPFNAEDQFLELWGDVQFRPDN